MVPSIRASDSDRELVAERLRHATAEGRLSTDELEERLEALSVARTYGELDRLVADLPVSRAPTQVRARVPLWLGAAGAVTLMLALLGMVAGAVRHFSEEARGLPGPLEHADHLLIAAASMAAVFVAFTAICGVLVWRFLRSRPARRAQMTRRAHRRPYF
jgi:hypothetical protein